jgi:flagellar hook-associated protein 3 FlgL
VSKAMDMRITSLMPSQIVLQNLNTTTNAILQDQTEIATGRVLTKPSDNPAALAQDLLLQESKSQVATWQNVAASALSVAQATDQALSQLETAANTAYTTVEQGVAAVGQAGDAALLAQLQAIEQSIEQIVTSSDAGVYLFGGDMAPPQPLLSGSPPQLAAGPAMQVTLGPNMSAPQNLGQDNNQVNGRNPVNELLAALWTAITVLQLPTYTVTVQFNYSGSTYQSTTTYNAGGTSDTISVSVPPGAPAGTPTSITAAFSLPGATSPLLQISVPVTDITGSTLQFGAPTTSQLLEPILGSLQTAQQDLVAVHAQFGTDMQRIQAAQSQLSQESTQLQAAQAQVEDAPIPNVVADLAEQETTYQAILETAANVLQPTLAEYLSRIG